MNNNIEIEKIKDSLFNGYMCISKYIHKVISFEDYYFSFMELLKIYIYSKIINIINEKFLLLIIINVVIFYSPIEDKCEHFLFKGKMAVKQFIIGSLGIISCFIPKYEEQQKENELNYIN